MSIATLLWSILAGIIALVIAIYQYIYKAKKVSKKLIFFAFLRFLSIFILLLLLINPKFKQHSYYAVKPILALAIDNTSSIDFLEKKDAVHEFVNTIEANKELEERFDIQSYSFSNSIADSLELNFKGKQTNITEAIETIDQIYKNRIAPVIVVTDGNQTYGNDYQYIGTKIKQPIYPIIVGDTAKVVDVKIQQLNVNKYAYLKNEFPVETIVVYNGDREITTQFTIKKGKDKVYSTSLTFKEGETSKVVYTTLPAITAGVHTYNVNITPITDEKNTVNNAKNFAIEVIDQKTEIVLITDILHPDIGALKKSIESNERRKVSIKKASEITSLEDYQLVLLYQPNSSFRSIFDLIKSQKKNYLTITGTQTDWRFLNSVQTHFTRSLSRQTEEYVPQFNANYNSYLIEDLGFSTYPPLTATFGNLKINNTHDILLTQTINGISINAPLLTTIEDQGIRTGALFGEGIWKWRAQEYLNNKDFKAFDEFTGKLVQYLASNKRRNRLDITAESFYYNNGEIKLQAAFFTKNYEFDNRASLNIRVKNKDTNEFYEAPLVLKNNYYESDLSILNPGEYDYTITVAGERISKSGKFAILNYDVEQQFLNADVTKLITLATNTTGKVFYIDQIDNIIEDLINDDRFQIIQKRKEEITPLIDWRYLLGILLLLLAIEWFMRKYNGLI
ncbi:VWA domain-containing protein [Aquimarina rhabdastrellae]